ncbi:hypothetical protein ACFPMF_14190 [Larkinella bovis]|uniref:DUF1778 domain-containing protein n=1 Tax=Larkinella bovis TaxID=683041 RepID=A0ABW0IEC6_9BACT
MKRLSKHILTSEVRADILRSAVASFRIEKIQISPEQAAATLRKVETTRAK